MLLAIGQASMGHRMRSLRGQERMRLRRLHFRFMALLVVLGVVHIALNGALARMVLSIA